MATPNRRQLWIGGVAKWCDHAILEEIKSQGGRVLAEACRACSLRVAEFGVCAGCKRDRRLTKFVASKRQAYCSDDCYRHTMAAASKAKAEERAAVAKAVGK